METIFSKPYVAGCFAWSGFDYRGEPCPYGWPSVISHWGFSDDCGFLKDIAYLLAAWYRDELVVHLLPHWNWEKNDNVRVCAYTNGDTAELFLNGKSFGEKEVKRKRAEWMVPFEKGTISVLVKRGTEEAYSVVHTSGKAAKIILENVTPDHQDKTSQIINLCVVDEEGVIVPDFSDTVNFVLNGGEILGIGNGDPNDHHSEKASSIRVFNGRAQIIVTGNTKELSVNCNGLTDAVIKLQEAGI